MTDLAHVATFVSLIYSLGVANVLANVSSLLKRRPLSDWYWVHSLWKLNLLVMMAGFWWVLHAWTPSTRKNELLDFLIYLGLLLVPSLLFVASDLLFPERALDHERNLKDHFLDIRKPFFVTLLCTLVAGVLDTWLGASVHVKNPAVYGGTQVYLFLAFLFGIRYESHRVHAWLVVSSLVAFIIWVSLGVRA